MDLLVLAIIATAVIGVVGCVCIAVCPWTLPDEVEPVAPAAPAGPDV